MRQNIADDKNLCEALRGEALKMRDSFKNCLEKLTLIPTENGELKSVALTHAYVLKRIIKLTKLIGLSQDDDFDSTMEFFIGDTTNSDEINYPNGFMNGGSKLVNGNNLRAQGELTGSANNNYLEKGSELSNQPESQPAQPSKPSGTTQPNVVTPIIKKIGWGKVDAVNKVPAKSFIDIQKEELSMKSTNS